MSNDESKKAYSVIGQVTIGTDEYRDLIEAVQEAKADTDKQRSNWYEQYNKANKLEADIKKISAVSDSYADFINSSEEIKAAVVQAIDREIGPIAKPKNTYIEPDMPKTRSGKIMRRILSAISIRRDVGVVTSLADPGVVEDVLKLVQG